MSATNSFVRKYSLIKQVVSDKSSLLLKIQKYNTPTLQLYTVIIKQKVFTKVIKFAKLKGLCFADRESK